MSRSLFATKTFCLNFLTDAVEVTGALSSVIPPGALTLVLASLNVAIRIITHGPVHVLTQAGDDDDAKRVITGGVPMPKVTTPKGAKKTFRSVSAAKTYAKKAGGKVSRVKGKSYTK